MTNETDQSTIISTTFAHEAQQILREVRGALTNVIERIEPRVLRATQLRDRLQLSQNLSWTIFNAMNTRDVQTLVSLLPGQRAMALFFAAAQNIPSIPPASIHNARLVFDRFEEFVTRSAGNRSAFETMISSEFGPTSENENGDVKTKRAAFRANSLLWGRQARITTGTLIVHPSSTPGRLDEALIRGTIDLRRTRRDIPPSVYSQRWRVPSPDGSSQIGTLEPIDSRDEGPDTVRLLQDFCSQPLPKFRVLESYDTHKSHELIWNGIGVASEVTYFAGDVGRGEWINNPVPEEVVQHGLLVATPVETYIGDTLIHESIWPNCEANARVYALPVGTPRDVQDSDMLPLQERVELLGTGIDAAHTMLIPRYTDMLGYALEQLKWNPDEFRVLRCQVEYPVMYTRITIRLHTGGISGNR